MDEMRILQAIAALNGRFDGVDGRFEKIDKRFDGLEGRFDGLEGRFHGLESRFDGLEGRFDELRGQFGGLELRFESQEGRQAGLETKFDELHRHFDVVSESLHGDIQLVAEGVSALSERQDRFELTVQQEFVATRALLEPPTRAIGRRVSHLEEDVDELRGRVGR